MSKPAVIAGVYVDCRFMPGLKSARISIDIPIEHSNEFLKAFGAPDRANPVHVAVARLEVGAYAPEGSGPAYTDRPGGSTEAPHAESQAQDKPRTYTRSQKAAMKCQTPDFQNWFMNTHSTIAQRNRLRLPLTGRLTAGEVQQLVTAAMKDLLGIQSRTELDGPGPAAVAFDRLLTDFDMRNTVRA